MPLVKVKREVRYSYLYPRLSVADDGVTVTLPTTLWPDTFQILIV